LEKSAASRLVVDDFDVAAAPLTERIVRGTSSVVRSESIAKDGYGCGVGSETGKKGYAPPHKALRREQVQRSLARGRTCDVKLEDVCVPVYCLVGKVSWAERAWLEEPARRLGQGVATREDHELGPADSAAYVSALAVDQEKNDSGFESEIRECALRGDDASQSGERDESPRRIRHLSLVVGRAVGLEKDEVVGHKGWSE